MPDFLFHIPPGDLRGLLDVARDAGHEFTPGQASADLALDLDRMRHPNPKMRLRKLHSRRFYAQRWSWTRASVQEAFSGDARREVEPWIEAQALDYLDRFRSPPDDAHGPVADSGGHSADSGGQKQARKASKGAIRGQVADSGGHSADKEEQSFQALQSGSVRERERETQPDARTDRPHGRCFASPAVAAYCDAVGAWPPVAHAEAIARRFADGISPDELTAWLEHVTTYAVTPTRNARNVPGIIQTFDEHRARAAAPADGSRGGGALGAPGSSPGRRAGAGVGRPRQNPRPTGTAAERGSGRTVAGTLDLLDRYPDQDAVGAEDDSAAGAG